MHSIKEEILFLIIYFYLILHYMTKSNILEQINKYLMEPLLKHVNLKLNLFSQLQISFNHFSKFTNQFRKYQDPIIIQQLIFCKVDKQTTILTIIQYLKSVKNYKFFKFLKECIINYSSVQISELFEKQSISYIYTIVDQFYQQQLKLKTNLYKSFKAVDNKKDTFQYQPKETDEKYITEHYRYYLQCKTLVSVQSQNQVYIISITVQHIQIKKIKISTTNFIKNYVNSIYYKFKSIFQQLLYQIKEQSKICLQKLFLFLIMEVFSSYLKEYLMLLFVSINFKKQFLNY
ncbi:unnamed protein product [Paramecium sonneborni]|uniref:Uncharacterized protein n=1 Tax=Paramecium sonneborni TaxID=65129 RepID=A0A8S1KMD5_9CILI|nr:unnamed protein product [Paramecium sonneborni]